METKLSQQRKHMRDSNKNILFVEVNVMNLSAKFQLHPPLMLLRRLFFREFILSVAMATYQIQHLDKIHTSGRGLLKEHFCKTFVKIFAVR